MVFSDVALERQLPDETVRVFYDPNDPTNPDVSSCHVLKSTRNNIEIYIEGWHFVLLFH